MGAITGQQEQMRLGYKVREDIQVTHSGHIKGRLDSKSAAVTCFHPEDKAAPVFLGKQLGEETYQVHCLPASDSGALTGLLASVLIQCNKVPSLKWECCHS